MSRLRTFIDQCNQQLYHSQGLNILWPRSNGFLFVRLNHYSSTPNMLTWFLSDSWRSNTMWACKFISRKGYSYWFVIAVISIVNCLLHHWIIALFRVTYIQQVLYRSTLARSLTPFRSTLSARMPWSQSGSITMTASPHSLHPILRFYLYSFNDCLIVTWYLSCQCDWKFSSQSLWMGK